MLSVICAAPPLIAGFITPLGENDGALGGIGGIGDAGGNCGIGGGTGGGALGGCTPGCSGEPHVMQNRETGVFAV